MSPSSTLLQPTNAPRNYNRGAENHILLCSIEEMTYPVSIDVCTAHLLPRAADQWHTAWHARNCAAHVQDIHRVFSLCGFVCKISTFEKTQGFQVTAYHCTAHDRGDGFMQHVRAQVMVQYADVATAVQAANTLEGYHHAVAHPCNTLNDLSLALLCEPPARLVWTHPRDDL